MLSAKCSKPLIELTCETSQSHKAARTRKRSTELKLRAGSRTLCSCRDRGCRRAGAREGGWFSPTRQERNRQAGEGLRRRSSVCRDRTWLILGSNSIAGSAWLAGSRTGRLGGLVEPEHEKTCLAAKSNSRKSNQIYGRESS